MSYSHLPIEERIEKAAEYGLMLVGDERPVADIVGELKAMFTLTEEQAQQAYIIMREKHSGDYKQAIKRKARFFWVMLFVSLAVGAFYAFLGTELGWGFYIVAAFFGLALFASFSNIVGLWLEKSVPAKKFLGLNKGRTIIPENSKLTGIPVFFFFMLLFTGIASIIHYRVENPAGLTKMENLVISKKVYLKYTGGKNKTYYYLFFFKGYSNEFRFEKGMYKYGRWKIDPDDFQPGDTLSAETKPKYIQRLSQAEEPGNVYLYNLKINGRWLINHEERNQRVKREDRMVVYVCGAGLLLSIIGVRLWYRYKADRNQLIADEAINSYRK
ncbi:MAG: hypothetical protein JNM88_01905 [Chitinophagaceae bacterium]|nr:hypothetical protein [Chitinophagaceae bacterium]